MADVTAHSLEDSTDPQFGDFFALLKPRVMSLVVFTAFAGFLVAPVSLHPFVGFCAILFIAIGAGASGALNMWWDADIDALMSRTKKRPIPSGRVTPGDALAIGVALSGFAVVLLALATNLLAGALLAFTIFFYAVVYSMWLKRSTPQNIVIGGAAGAFPPMIGWVAATGSISIEAVLMFGIIFMWTPPHFWALALFMKDDYHIADVPMLTVTHGRKATRLQVLIYTVLLTPVALALAFTPVAGPAYLVASLAMSLWFLVGAIAIYRRDEVQSEADGYKVEKGVFKTSLYYLFALFGALILDAAIGWQGLVLGLLV